VANLDKLQAMGDDGQKQMLVRGTVVAGSGAYAVNVNGNVLPVSSIDPVAVSAGDSVLVAVIAGASGQAEAIVLGRMANSMRPATGTVTVVPVGSQTITVTGSDGATYTAYFLSGYTPAVNDNVEITFIGGYPYVSKAGVTPTPPPVQTVAAPPTAPSSGTTNFAAADSATYWSGGGWGSWGRADHVYSGTWGGSTVNGAWFYAGGPGQIQGRTILGGRFILGARDIGSGNYNSPATVNLYTHGSPNRPGGNVSTINGPTVVTAQPWQGLTTYSLSQAQAQDLVNGGGIAIFGGDYAAFQGIQANAQSGTISIDWSR
jgi:hypothetical protein